MRGAPSSTSPFVKKGDHEADNALESFITDSLTSAPDRDHYVADKRRAPLSAIQTVIMRISPSIRQHPDITPFFPVGPLSVAEWNSLSAGAAVATTDDSFD